jgi:catechol 2,3-dioxygenase-like lactoylglutathione lyase family enzyme
MPLGHIIFYVPDVAATVDFYETAFGFQKHRDNRASGTVDMISGKMIISFLSEATAKALGHPFTPLRPDSPPPGIELILERVEVLPAYIRALLAGATPIEEPALNALGQMVAVVRDLNGVMVELCAPSPAETA